MENINEEIDRARWRRLESLFHRAVGLPPDQREAVLAAECADDKTLLAEVLSMLISGEREDSFLGEPAFDLGLSILAAQQSISLIGQTLGPYRLLKHLGRGGMGEVYLAEDPRLGRKVALKLPPESVTSDPKQVADLEMEARSASAVSHPHVAHVYETGDDRGRRYIAMEYVEGGTLRNALKEGAAPLGRALEIAAQVASALSAAHAAGVVHRDIKPENVMLRPDGYVKVLDFGLASQSSLSPGGGNSSGRVGEPQPLPMGTAQYMSPEQARGEQIDGRTDLWSLGVVLFEMVTGRAPFEGDTVGDMLASILRTELNLDSLPAGLPVEIRRIIGRALQKDREKRYRTAEAMLTDLNDLKRQLELSEALERSVNMTRERMTSQGVTGDTVNVAAVTHYSRGAGTIGGRVLSNCLNLGKRLWHNTVGITAGLVILVIFLGGVTYVSYWHQKDSGRGKPPGQLILTGSTQGTFLKTLTTQGGVSDLAVSPDGKYIAYASGAGFSSLRIIQVTDGSEREIVPPSIGFYGELTFSRGGDYIYYLHSGEGARKSTLYRVRLTGGIPQRLMGDLPARRRSFALAPDEQRMALIKGVPGGDTHIVVANTDGTDEQVIYSGSREELLSPAWSPDGRVIACVRRDSQSLTSVVGVELTGMAAKQLTPGTWPLIYHIAWLEDSKGLVMSASQREVPNPPQLWLLSYPGGRVSRITNNLNSYTSFSLTKKADLIAAVQDERLSDVWVTSMESTDFSQKITSGERDGVGGVAWMGDSRILYSSYTEGNYDIWSSDPGGGDKKRLTSSAGWNIWPSASSDGRYVVFSSNRTGLFTVWRMNADGTDQRQLVDHESIYPQISRDGSWVTFLRPSNDKYTLWQVSIEGGYIMGLPAEGGLSRPAISPDGRASAYFLAEENGYKLAVVPIGDASPRKEFPSRIKVARVTWPPPSSLALGAYYVRWSSDGRTITYKNSLMGRANIWGQPLEGGAAQELVRFNCVDLLSFDWSPDGRRLVAACGDYRSNIVLINKFR